MKSLLKIFGLFFISANMALATGNVSSTAKGKVESSKSVVESKANDPGKGQFKPNRPALVKPDDNVNKSADKGRIVPNPTRNVKPDNSAK